MSDKAQLDHLLLDVDFLHKPKIRSFKRQFGMIACLWLIEVYCQMSRATNGVIDEDTILDVADDMQLTSVAKDMIAYCIDDEKQLITKLKDGNGFTNLRVNKDQVSLAAKRQKEREKTERYRNKTVTEPDMLPEKAVTLVTVPATDTVTELRSINNGAWIDDITNETAILAFASYGLTAADLPRAKQIVERYWEGNPNKRRKSDLFASWTIQELLKEKTQAARFAKTQAPPPGEENEFDAMAKRVAEKMAAKKGIK
jgi:hypothetical protein